MKRVTERGFALPIVVAVLMILVFMSFFLLSQLVRHRQTTQLTSELLTAQYAAESGIAFMQQRLQQQPELQQDHLYHWGDYYVTTRLTARGEYIELESRAVGKRGVRQTIRVKLDPKTLAIREWLK
jgi:type II secretory pathway pseudopilin PulG